ncbi:MAG: 30S ribosomal protein THX [Pyrinomonadaceae bacterium]
MGRGDKRSRRGKIFAGSYGKTRPKKKDVKKTNTENTEKKSGE